jgi:hypothetical protein
MRLLSPGLRIHELWPEVWPVEGQLRVTPGMRPEYRRDDGEYRRNDGEYRRKSVQAAIRVE